MEQPVHTLENLFNQLGLDSTPSAIEAFIAAHPLPEDMKLEEAPFWNVAQKQLLEESRAQDADWAEVVDALAALLRHQN